MHAIHKNDPHRCLLQAHAGRETSWRLQLKGARPSIPRKPRTLTALRSFPCPNYLTVSPSPCQDSDDLPHVLKNVVGRLHSCSCPGPGRAGGAGGGGGGRRGGGGAPAAPPANARRPVAETPAEPRRSGGEGGGGAAGGARGGGGGGAGGGRGGSGGFCPPASRPGFGGGAPGWRRASRRRAAGAGRCRAVRHRTDAPRYADAFGPGGRGGRVRGRGGGAAPAALPGGAAQASPQPETQCHREPERPGGLPGGSGGGLGLGLGRDARRGGWPRGPGSRRRGVPGPSSGLPRERIPGGAPEPGSGGVPAVDKRAGTPGGGGGGGGGGVVGGGGGGLGGVLGRHLVLGGVVRPEGTAFPRGGRGARREGPRGEAQSVGGGGGGGSVGERGGGSSTIASFVHLLLLPVTCEIHV